MPRRGDARASAIGPKRRSPVSRPSPPLNLSPSKARSDLRQRCVDVYLNGDAYWDAVPVNVWEYIHGSKRKKNYSYQGGGSKAKRVELPHLKTKARRSGRGIRRAAGYPQRMPFTAPMQRCVCAKRRQRTRDHELKFHLVL
jgi:hypothetical protein